MMKTTTLLASVIAVSMFAGCADEADRTDRGPPRGDLSVGPIDVLQTSAGDGSVEEIRFPDLRSEEGTATWRGQQWEAFRSIRPDGSYDLAFVSDTDIVELECRRPCGRVTCEVISSGSGVFEVGFTQDWKAALRAPATQRQF